MKKLITVAISLGMIVSAQAADKKAAAPAAKPAAAAAAAPSKSWSRNYGMAGCGLGSMIVGKKGGQIFAATTNSTAYNQFFGITFGTSNCVDSPTHDMAMRMDQFVAGNKVAIAGDMARGSGETLANLSAMMGCNSSSDQFGAAMQKNFRSIFPDATVAPNEVTDSIISVIINDQSLASSCKVVG